MLESSRKRLVPGWSVALDRPPQQNLRFFRQLSNPGHRQPRQPLHGQKTSVAPTRNGEEEFVILAAAQRGV
jgi:hypothetical protein